jgi:hypothetical protein
MYDIDICTPLTEEEKNKVIEGLAKKVAGRRLEAPAVMFLDMHRPLSFLASQSLLVAMPLLAPVFGAQGVADLSKLLANPDNVEALIRRIEEMSAEMDNDKPSASAAADTLE